jgi:hypothetical protein
VEACCELLAQLATIGGGDAVPLAVSEWVNGALRTMAMTDTASIDATICGDARLAAFAGASLAEWFANAAHLNSAHRRSLFDATQVTLLPPNTAKQ